MEEMEQNEDVDSECLCEDEEDCRWWLCCCTPTGGSGCEHVGGAGKTKVFWIGLEAKERIMEARSAFMTAGSGPSSCVVSTAPSRGEGVVLRAIVVSAESCD